MIAKGVVHTVGKGETLWSISRTYGVEPQDVAEINNIKDPGELEAGRKIFIPGVSERKSVKPRHNAPVKEKEKEGKIVVDKNRFIWPVRGEVESEFGMRGGSRHDGIDIKAPEGTPVKAADAGEVIYVSSAMKGYGNIIIVKHRDDFYTVYAHNKENLVKTGDNVARGDVIARVGKSGNASNNHLHFEVRHGKTVRNPLFFLP